VCGETLRPYGRGATRRYHGPRWTCPRAWREVAPDAAGILRLAPDAVHGGWLVVLDQAQIEALAAEHERAASGQADRVPEDDGLPF
jgi:hypothetical protein